MVLKFFCQKISFGLSGNNLSYEKFTSKKMLVQNNCCPKNGSGKIVTRKFFAWTNVTLTIVACLRCLSLKFSDYPICNRWDSGLLKLTRRVYRWVFGGMDGWIGYWRKYYHFMAPSCKLELARFSAKLIIQDGAECGNINLFLFISSLNVNNHLKD